MPNFDGTGPQGSGAMTGHGGGYCVKPLSKKTEDDESTSYEQEDNKGMFFRRQGLGLGFGRGHGRGFRRRR